MKRFTTLFFVFVLSFSVALMGANQKIVIDGSTTVGPIAKAFAEYYMALKQRC